MATEQMMMMMVMMMTVLGIARERKAHCCVYTSAGTESALLCVYTEHGNGKRIAICLREHGNGKRIAMCLHEHGDGKREAGALNANYCLGIARGSEGKRHWPLDRANTSRRTSCLHTQMRFAIADCALAQLPRRGRALGECIQACFGPCGARLP